MPAPHVSTTAPTVAMASASPEKGGCRSRPTSSEASSSAAATIESIEKAEEVRAPCGAVLGAVLGGAVQAVARGVAARASGLMGVPNSLHVRSSIKEAFEQKEVALQ